MHYYFILFFSECEMTMADLGEAFKGEYGRAGKSKHGKKMIFNSPTGKTDDAMEENREIIDKVSRSLPIASSPDADMEDNYTPSKHAKSSNQMEPSSVKDYTPPAYPATPDYAYQPVSLPGPPRGEWDRRLDKLIRRMDREQTGETSTHDMVLYIFTGVFFLFVLDTFVTLGKRSGR
jgi:hypothetical protein